jgi:hypothetical protein
MVMELLSSGIGGPWYEHLDSAFFQLALSCWFLCQLWHTAGWLASFCPAFRDARRAPTPGQDVCRLHHHHHPFPGRGRGPLIGRFERLELLPGAVLVGLTGKAGHGKDTVGGFLDELAGLSRMSFAAPLKEAARALWELSDEQLYGEKKNEVDPRWGVSPRVAMQKLGTEVARDMFPLWMPGLGANFWLKHFLLRYKRARERRPDRGVVVCDVRFPNEAALVRKLGGVVVRVNRPGHSSHGQPPAADEDARGAAGAASSAAHTAAAPSRSAAERGVTGLPPETTAVVEPPAAVGSADAPAARASHASETALDGEEADLTIENVGTLAELREQVRSVVLPWLWARAGAPPPARDVALEGVLPAHPLVAAGGHPKPKRTRKCE